MKKAITYLLSLLMLMMINCSDDAPTEVESITLKGTVVDKETQQPLSGVTISAGNKEVNTDASGNYELTNLDKGIMYVRAEKDNYASYLEEVEVSAGENVTNIELETMSAYCASHSTITYKGREYNTVYIGNQCWFKENLNYGTQINIDQESANNPTVEKYCYSNNTMNCDKFGGLYKWNEAMRYIFEEGGQGICPDTWHIPKFEELEVLKIAVGEDGNALKEVGIGDGEGVGTNTSGFTALFGGYLISYADDNPFYENLNNWTLFWTSTESGFEDAFVGDLNRASSNFALGHRNRNWGISIRCIKD